MRPYFVYNLKNALKIKITLLQSLARNMRTTSAFMLMLAQTGVEATPANIVDIDHLKQFNMYLGSTYIGSQFRQWTVILDTLSDWTLIGGNYDVKSSTTHRQ